MLRIKTIRILGIDPGTKETGVAVSDGDELVYWGVKTLKRDGRRSCKDVLNLAVRRIGKLIQDYEPQVLVLEKSCVISRQNSAALCALTREIKTLARKDGLKISEHAPATIKKCLCGTERSSKLKVAKEIAARYPELERYLTPSKGWNRSREKYWQKMFCALSLCLTYWQKNQEKHG
jgi:Holliday junction resolvasome RuvABC endonuclease subunit